MATTAALLRLAAEALDDGRDPLANPFLSDNDVTLDQLLTMAEMLAVGARVVADGIENPRSPAGQAMLLQMAASA